MAATVRLDVSGKCNGGHWSVKYDGVARRSPVVTGREALEAQAPGKGAWRGRPGRGRRGNQVHVRGGSALFLRVSETAVHCRVQQAPQCTGPSGRRGRSVDEDRGGRAEPEGTGTSSPARRPARGLTLPVSPASTPRAPGTRHLAHDLSLSLTPPLERPQWVNHLKGPQTAPYVPRSFW